MLEPRIYRIAGTAARFGLAMFFSAGNDADGILRGLHVDTVSRGSEHQRTVQLQKRVTSLYEEFRTPLYRYLLCLGLLAQDVEDIIQETFLRLYQHLHGRGAEDNLRAWIYRVAHNLSVNSRKAHRFVVETSPEFWRHLSESLPDSIPGPEEWFLHRERMECVQKTLGELSRLQRDCVHLRAENFRYREIAEILGVHTATVSSSLHNAITRLTREMHEKSIC